MLLPIGGQQLAEFYHNVLQRRVLMLPGRYVLVVRGAIIEAQVRSHRPSYINALLIQSRGRAVRTLCTVCQTQMTASTNGWARPFSVCIRLPNHFGGAYANCKWRDHAGRYSVRDGQANDTDESGLSDDDRLGRDLEAGPTGDGGQYV